MLKAPLLAAVFAAGLSAPAMAAGVPALDVLQSSGGGGVGFLSNLQAQFVVSNFVPNSNDFNPGDGFWSTATAGGVGAPSVSTVSDPMLPDNTAGNVSSVIFPATTAGSSESSVLTFTDTNLFGETPLSFSVWAKVTSGTGALYTTISRSTIFGDAPITNDGHWHLIQATWIGESLGVGLNNVLLQIGINQADPNQRVAGSATTVELAGAYFVKLQSANVPTFADVKTGGPLAVTGSPPLSAAVTKPFPAGVALRDPGVLANFAGNPFVTANPAENWASNILTNPTISSQFQSGGFYWGWASECTGSPNIFVALCLLKSTDGLHWAEDTTNAPYLLAPGANLSGGTVGTAAAPAPAKFMLHPSFLPFGCSDGTSSHPDCIIWSAEDLNNNGHLYMAWSNTVNGVYTPIGCAGPGMCSTATPVSELNFPSSGFQNQGVPTVLNVGGASGLNYIYAYSGGGAGDSGQNYAIFTTPASSSITTSGNTLTFIHDAGLTLDVGLDWYAPTAGTKFLDPFIFQDHCGIFHFYFTVENTAVPNPPWFAGAPSFTQLVGEAVSNLVAGPWFQFTKPIISGTSPAFAASGVGDPTAIELNGQLIMTLAYTAPSSLGSGFALTGPQGTCPGQPQAAPASATRPVITGTAQTGDTLTAGNGAWTNSPTLFSVQWLSNGSPISGATSSIFVPTSAQVGDMVSAALTATNARGSTTTTSASVGPVTAPSAPTNSVLPVISGSPIVGDTLTATDGTWTGSPTSFAFLWSGTGSPLTNSTYIPVSGDVGNNVTVRVTATNGTGSTPATSAAVGPVTTSPPVNSVAPVISGTHQVGSTLTVSDGTWSGSPTFTFSWNGAGSPLTNSTYVPVTGDVGNNLIATVTATNSAGSASQPSAAVGPVTAASSCAQATTYLARTSGGNEGGNAAPMTTLICGLVADGVITGNMGSTGCGTGSFDALYIEAQQNQADALLNLCGTNFSQTIGGTLTFTSLTGFSGFNTNPSNALSSNFNSTTATSPNFTQSAASYGFWTAATILETVPQMGTGGTNASGTSNLFDDFTGSIFHARVNNPADTGVTAPTTGTAGLFVAERPSSTSVIPYFNGAAQTTQTETSEAPLNANFMIGNVEPGVNGSQQTIREAHVGGALGPTLNLAIFNRLSSYMAAP